ncbi:MAG: PEP-CTERM sorting domain-containing protein [Tepidisphaeraceae bacterium]|jgi:hypothetical protein
MNRKTIPLLAAAAFAVATHGHHAWADVNESWIAGGGGNWATANNWSPNTNYPNNGTPVGTNYQATISLPGTSAYTVTVGSNIAVDSLSIGSPNATLSDSGNLTLGGLTVTSGAFNLNGGTLIAANGATTYSLGAGTNLNLTNGTISGGSISSAGSTTVTNATLNGVTIDPGTSLNIASAGMLTLSGAWSNSGTISGANSTLTLGGTFGLAAIGSLNLTNSTADLTGTLTLNPTDTFTVGGSSAVGGSSTTWNLGGTISGGTLLISSGTTAQCNNLQISGNAINNGILSITGGGDGVFDTVTFSNSTLSGTGVLNLGGSGWAAINGTLTQSAGHTIQGLGTINAALTNNGIVNANNNGSTLELTANSINNNLMEGTDGGEIVFDGITLTQGYAGQITSSGTSSAQSRIVVASSTISGGTITVGPNTSLQLSGSELGSTITGATVLVQAGGSLFDYAYWNTSSISGLTNNGSVSLYGTLDINGDMTDNGTITIYDNEYAYPYIDFNGGNLFGAGTLNLNNSKFGVRGTLIQGSGHTISGAGIISAALVNDGIVNANNSTGTLYVSGTTTNNGTLEASNGGFLYVSSSNFTNNGALVVHSGTIYVEHGLNLGEGTLEGSGLVWANPIIFANDPSQLIFNIGGTAQASSYDSLTMEGNVTLGGDLDIAFADGFQSSITSSEQFLVMTLVSGYGFTLSGSFLNVPNGGRLETADGYGTFQVNYGSGQYADEIVLSDFQATVPEPVGLSLLGLGSLGLLVRKRRRARWKATGA